MAGGIFVSQNKVRPGAYINFKGVGKPLSSVGVRGVMTMPVAMSWGATVTELYSTDLVDGKSLEKIGFTAEDESSLVFRLALENAYKAIIYRLDTGGTAASGVISDLELDAKYAGVVGNDITVSVVVNGSNFDVITYHKGIQKDKQTVADSTELLDNAWVNFGYTTGTLTANAGTALTGGLNGSVVDGTYATYLGVIQAYNFNTMAIPQEASSVTASIITAIKAFRDTDGKKVQCVLYNVDEDHEGIISVDQGFTTATETITPEIFPAYVAGLTAGSDAAQSNTHAVVLNALSIVYPDGVTPYTSAEIILKLQNGKFILSTRSDGAVIVEQDINTFHTFTPTKGYAFSKNRVIRTLDEINNTTSLLFSKSYIGKVSNNENGRTLFKADLIKYFKDLQSLGAIENFKSEEDITIQAGESIDAIVVNLAIQVVDAIEKLYMTVNVG